MSDLIGIIQSVIRDQLQGFKTAELGVVSKVYPHEGASDNNNYECDVKLRDTGLELKRVPVATARMGSVAIPNEEDLVIIQYFRGDIHSAVVTGSVYNDQVRAPEAKAREFVYISPDTPEKDIRRIYMEFPNKNKLLLDDDKVLLTMGKTMLEIDNDGDVKLKSEGKLVIDAKGDTTLKTGGKLEFSVTGDMIIDAANVAIKGKGNATFEAATAATLKGASVKIAGKTDFSLA